MPVVRSIVCRCQRRSPSKGAAEIFSQAVDGCRFRDVLARRQKKLFPAQPVKSPPSWLLAVSVATRLKGCQLSAAVSTILRTSAASLRFNPAGGGNDRDFEESVAVQNGGITIGGPFANEHVLVLVRVLVKSSCLPGELQQLGY